MVPPQASTDIGHWEFLIAERRFVWSRTALQILGADSTSGVLDLGDPLSLIHPDDRAAVETAIRDTAAGDGTLDVICRSPQDDGRPSLHLRGELDASAETRPRLWGTLSHAGAGSACESVLSLSPAETICSNNGEQIRRGNPLYAALGKVHEAMVRVTTRDELLLAICRVLVEQGGFRMSWVGWNDANAQTLRPVAQWGDDQEYLKQTISRYTGDHATTWSPAATAFRNGTSIVSNDALEDPATLRWRDAMRLRGFRAVAVFPIRVRGVVCGTLAVFADEVGVFRDEEVALLEGAVANLSFALDREAHTREIETQRARLAEAQAVAHMGSWDADFRTGVVEWSEETHRIFETVPGEFRPTFGGFIERVHPDDRAAVEQAVRTSGATTAPVLIEHRVPFPDGRIKIVEERWRSFTDDAGATVRATGSCHDVTEQRQTARTLEQAARRTRMLADSLTTTLESLTDAFYTLDREWRFTYVNHEAERVVMRNRSEMIGARMMEVFPGFIETPFGRALRRAAVERAPVQCEDYHPPLGRWFEMRIYPSSDGLAVYFRDVTDRRRTNQQLRMLALKLESVQEAERSMIAREVHDELGQLLTVLRLDAARLARMISREPEAAALLAEMVATIDTTLDETRSIATALHPVALDDLGLAAAVELHATQIARRANLRVTLDLPCTEIDDIDRPRAGAVYRVLQESLTNVVRHAQACAVRVRLASCASEIVLEVTDDGRGISAEQLEGTGSLGLLGMRERAAAFDGMLTIAPARCRGTTVLLRLPRAAAGA